MRVLLALVLVFLGWQAAFAQTDTPVPPTPTDTPTPLPTFTPYALEGTLGTPTNIPALSLTPKPWYTPTRPLAGTAFQVPPFPNFPAPGIGENPVESGFEAISESNSLRLGLFIAETMVSFYAWCAVNFPTVLRALRIMTLIYFFMVSMYAIIQRLAPDLAARVSNWRGMKGSPLERSTRK